MKWNNLKSNRCPKCGKDLGKMFYDGRFRGSLIMCECGFSISEKRCKEIITDMVSRGIRQEEKHYRPEDEVPDIEI